ncbi:hypothetical protein BKA70DRAFT_1297253 [Coprinopsis sp. MPI-PUGE-AT-0042]|nr:hypothetical protein BKA70DRAFT_1297253 [Coprinopsis sp. MPI-PUGE-AT-0042]
MGVEALAGGVALAFEASVFFFVVALSCRLACSRSSTALTANCSNSRRSCSVYILADVSTPSETCSMLAAKDSNWEGMGIEALDSTCSIIS